MVGRVSQHLSYLLCTKVNSNASLAWTTAAVDNERVIGAVPIVMDILNLNQVGNK